PGVQQVVQQVPLEPVGDQVLVLDAALGVQLDDHVVGVVGDDVLAGDQEGADVAAAVGRDDPDLEVGQSTRGDPLLQLGLLLGRVGGDDEAVGGREQLRAVQQLLDDLHVEGVDDDRDPQPGDVGGGRDL